MGSKSKGRKAEINNDNNNNNCDNKSVNFNVIGKGKVTPFQVAFIVDRYLADNNFTRTRACFRSEASSLIPKSSLTQVPNSLMSLGELLDEYIWLKEQKVIIEQQKCGLAQEKCRIHTLLQGMQGVMNAYNSATTTVNCLTPPPPVVPSTSIPVTCSSGYLASTTPVNAASAMTTQSVKMDRAGSATPITGGRPPRKRRSSYKDVEDTPKAPKKLYSGPLANYPFRGKVSAVGEPSNTCSSKQSPAIDSMSPNFTQGGLPIQGSSVVKNLFDQPSRSPTSNSSVPKTPPRAVSSPSDKSISPQEDISSTAMSQHTTIPADTTPTKCTIISSKTIIVSPTKHFSIERNECTFSSPVNSSIMRKSKRDHVKSRLEFDDSDVPSSLENASGDGSSTSESEKEGDTFDMDLPNFDAFGPDFSLTELLTDFGIDCENLNNSCSGTACTSTGAILESVHERNTRELETSQDLIEQSSTVTDVAATNTVNVKTVRKCITIVSPTKSAQTGSALDKENPSV